MHPAASDPWRTAGEERSRALWALVLLSIVGFMVTLDTMVVGTALPAMERSLGATLPTLSWSVNAYVLTFGSGIIAGAALGDRFGRRRLLTTGLVLFALASAACALSPSAAALIAARAIQGLGAALVSPLSLALLASAFPASRRGTVIGLWSAVAGLAVAAGPVVGGILTGLYSWHWIFWINVPIGLAVALLASVRLAESHGPAARLDLPAVVLVGGGAAVLIWALVRADAAGWGSAAVLAGLAPGATLLAAFVVWEGRAREPMVPLRLFKNRNFAAATVCGFLMSAAIVPSAVLLLQYMQLAMGSSPALAGLRFLPMTATPLLVAPAAGLLSDRIGPRLPMFLGMVLFGLGLAWLGRDLSPGAYAPMILPLVVAGLGASMPLATTATAALSAVAPADLGKASGVINTLRQFGGAFGLAVVLAIFAAHGPAHTPAAMGAGLRSALTAAAAVAWLGALAAASVRGRSPEPVLRTPEA